MHDQLSLTYYRSSNYDDSCARTAFGMLERLSFLFFPLYFNIAMHTVLLCQAEYISGCGDVTST